MTRRALTPLIVGVCLCAALFTGACHRRRGRNGACVAHIDCDPGYDCRERRCVKRAPFPGSVVEPAAPARVEPAPPDEPAPREAPARRDEPPGPPPPPSPGNRPPPASAPELPAWKARLKNI